MHALRVLRRLITIDVTRTLIYRGEFVVYMLSIVVGPAVALLVWRAAAANGATLPVTMEYLVTYFVLLGVVNMLVSSWLAWWLAEMIRLGQLSIWLVRPASVFLNLIANNLSEKLIKVFILAPMIAILGWFFRDQLRLPADPALWALFGLSVLLAATITFAVDVVIGALAFWFEDIGGFWRLRFLAGTVLSGQLVPLALFPDWTAGFIAVQPFRYMLSFPSKSSSATSPPATSPSASSSRPATRCWQSPRPCSSGNAASASTPRWAHEVPKPPACHFERSARNLSFQHAAVRALAPFPSHEPSRQSGQNHPSPPHDPSF